MKLAAICCFILAACGVTITPAYIDKLTLLCTANGGVDSYYFPAKNDNKIGSVYCKNGAVFSGISLGK